MVGLNSGLTSATGLLSLLEEDQDELKVYALTKLDEVVDHFWAEIADSVEIFEVLYEDPAFSQRELAALVTSKVYYHLGELSLSMQYALGAGKLFDVSAQTEYIDTLVSTCIDEYIRLRQLNSAAASGAKDVKAEEIDGRLERIVENMFDRCFAIGEFKHALGVALESHRFDKITEAVEKSDDIPGILSYCTVLCKSVLENRGLRHSVLSLLVGLYRKYAVTSNTQPDHISICHLLIALNQPDEVSDALKQLIDNASPDDELLAFQIAFDLYDNGSQAFLQRVREGLPAPPVVEVKDEVAADAAVPDAAVPDAASTTEATPLLSADAEAMDTDETKEEEKTDPPIAKLHRILTGEISIGLNLEFLYRQNHSDLKILDNIKNAQGPRTNSVTHNATVLANAIMHAGTTRDLFLRNNLEWLSRATNWAKFTAIAGLGVIHKGQLKEGLTVLGPYLPSGAGGAGAPAGNPGASAYAEGGALYALGLINANHGGDITQYLIDALRGATGNETVQHGACLGLGLAAMATGNMTVYDELKNVLYNDSAVAGEAAGMAMGLVMLGTANAQALEEMMAYAHETQHEKIIRGLAMGLSFIMCLREEEADTLIEQLTLDKDPILRYGGMYTIALAYAGSSNNNAIRRLLHIAVSDVSDDVRRAAVTGLGFLLIRQPEQCPRLVALLAESYNPHVRYGATIAVGISCAGTASKEAIALLEPMTKDAVDFVRQGALVALAMVLIQTSKESEPKVETVRKIFAEKAADRHEQILAKFGAILASGIVDAGGRNVTIATCARSGDTIMPAIVGLAVFTQFWYWYPYIHFLSLSLTPTSIIGLNKDLKMPKFSFTSNARPSLFAYPEAVKEPEKAEIGKLKTAVLSITKRANQRKAEKEKKEKEKEGKKEEDGDAKMEVVSDAKKEAGGDKKDAADGEKKDEEKEKEKEKEPEPLSEVLENPARVTTAQLPLILFDADARYTPVLSAGVVHGFVLLRDNKEGEEEELVVPTAVKSADGGAAQDGEEDEPDCPEAFEYN